MKEYLDSLPQGLLLNVDCIVLCNLFLLSNLILKVLSGFLFLLVILHFRFSFMSTLLCHFLNTLFNSFHLLLFLPLLPLLPVLFPFLETFSYNKFHVILWFCSAIFYLSFFVSFYSFFFFFFLSCDYNISHVLFDTNFILIIVCSTRCQASTTRK